MHKSDFKMRDNLMQKLYYDIIFTNNISFLIYYLYFCDKIKTNKKWNSLQKLCKKSVRLCGDGP